MKPKLFSDTENISIKAKIIERQLLFLKSLTKENTEVNEDIKDMKKYSLILQELTTNFQNKNYSEFMKIYNILEKQGKISDVENIFKNICEEIGQKYEKLDSNYNIEKNETKIFWQDQWQIPFTIKKDNNIYILELKNYTLLNNPTKYSDSKTLSASPQTIDIILRQYIGNELQFKNKIFYKGGDKLINFIQLKKTNEKIRKQSTKKIIEIKDVTIYDKKYEYMTYFYSPYGYSAQEVNTHFLLEELILKKYDKPKLKENLIIKISKTIHTAFYENHKILREYKITL